MGEPPTLTELDDGVRTVAMACYDAVLRPHLEEGVPLTRPVTRIGAS